MGCRRLAVWVDNRLDVGGWLCVWVDHAITWSVTKVNIISL